jgi:hypothetical protein
VFTEPYTHCRRTEGGTMKRFLALITIALLGTVGFVHLSEASETEVLLVTQRDQVDGCKRLGKVTGSSALGGFFAQNLGKANAEKEMINKTERMGGNVILVHSSEGGFNGAKAVGDAYLCSAGAQDAGQKQAPPAETPAGGQGGCLKDTDCKGERVCESGRCVKP